MFNKMLLVAVSLFMFSVTANAQIRAYTYDHVNSGYSTNVTGALTLEQDGDSIKIDPSLALFQDDFQFGGGVTEDQVVDSSSSEPIFVPVNGMPCAFVMFVPPARFTWHQVIIGDPTLQPIPHFICFDFTYLPGW